MKEMINLQMMIAEMEAPSEAFSSLLLWYQSLQNLLGEGRLYCQFDCSYKQALDELKVSPVSLH